MAVSYKIVFSTDNGATWHFDEEIDLEYAFYSSNNRPFKEDKQGNIFYFGNIYLFKFDKSKLEFKIFYSMKLYDFDVRIAGIY